MQHRSSIEIWQYWERIRGANAAPVRRDVDPCAIGSILPDLFILEMGKDGRPLFRLAGTRICNGFGRELRGTRFADLWVPPQRDSIQMDISDVMSDEAPMVAQVTATSLGGQSMVMEMAVLPMRSNGTGSDRAIGALSVDHRVQWYGNDPLVELAGARFYRISGITAEFKPPPSSTAFVGISSTTTGTATAKPLLLKILDGGRTQQRN